MAGTPFETLLEPISQPALEHEIVVGLIKRSEPCGVISGISERGIFRNRISRDNYRFAYHGIDLPIARSGRMALLGADQCAQQALLVWGLWIGATSDLLSGRQGDPRSIIVLTDTISAPLVALRLVRGHVPPSHLEIPTKAASTFSALPPGPQPCPRRRGGQRRRQMAARRQYEPSWDPQTSRRQFRFV